MDCILSRFRYDVDGIFGSLSSVNGSFSCMTLEHAFEQLDHSYEPIIPEGTYKCLRGQHELHSGPIETFEVTGVDGHTGLLFHYGNYNADSDGCVLIGETVDENMITNSRQTFADFMSLQTDVNEFTLIVQ